MARFSHLFNLDLFIYSKIQLKKTAGLTCNMFLTSELEFIFIFLGDGAVKKKYSILNKKSIKRKPN